MYYTSTHQFFSILVKGEPKKMGKKSKKAKKPQNPKKTTTKKKIKSS